MEPVQIRRSRPSLAKIRLERPNTRLRITGLGLVVGKTLSMAPMQAIAHQLTKSTASVPLLARRAARLCTAWRWSAGCAQCSASCPGHGFAHSARFIKPCLRSCNCLQCLLNQCPVMAMVPGAVSHVSTTIAIWTESAIRLSRSWAKYCA